MKMLRFPRIGLQQTQRSGAPAALFPRTQWGVLRQRAAGLLAVGGVLLIAPLCQAESSSEPIALVGATVHPVSSPPLEKGVVLIEGDTLKGVGSQGTVPSGYRRIDVEGKHIYPAFVHPGSVLGLAEVGSVRGSVDTNESGDLHPDLRVEVAFHADSRLLPPTRSGGVLHSLIVPQGGLVAGTSAVLRLDGWNWQEMTVRSPVGMHIHFPTFVATGRGSFRGPAKTQEEVDEEKDKALDQLRNLFAAARAYGKAQKAQNNAQENGPGKSPLPSSTANSKLQAMQPVLHGSVKVFLHARERKQIEGALEFARQQELEQVVLVTGPDAADLAPRIAELGISVVLNGVLSLPNRSWQPYDSAFTAAARLNEVLREKGIPLAIGDGGHRFAAANARNLPFHAAMAAAHGLPPEAALRSITLGPAEILGVQDRLGSLEVGKEASLLITDGDPLEITTTIEQVWLAGEALDLTDDPQRRLYERYRHRPLPSPN